MRVVVTGATGTLGSSLLELLERDDDVEEVVGLARRVPQDDGGRRKVRWVAADVSRSDLEPALAGADAVVHLAWVLNPSRDRALLRRINVDGTKRLLAAARAAGVRQVVLASSLGAYAPGPKDREVDESWPTDGIPGFAYSEDKVAVERHVDELEAAEPDLRIARMRPTLALKRSAAQHLRRELAGPWVPSPLLHPRLLPLVPDHPRLRAQIAHADDVADAFRLALHARARGAFNLAAGPVVDGESFAAHFGGRTVRVPRVMPLVGLHRLAHAVRLVPGEPGWSLEVLLAPLLDSGRAHRELGWVPRRTSFEALDEVLAGVRDRAGAPTPALDPAAGGPLRVREVLSAAGTRGPLSS